MLAPLLLLLVLVASGIGWIAFVYEDVVAAYDGDPNTHTASELIKSWRRAHGVLGLLALLGPLALLWGGATLLVMYLFLHLALELV